MATTTGLTTTATRTAPATRRGPSSGRLTHPWAWWCWALGVAVTVSLTSNPLFLLLLAAAVVFVVLWRRTDAPWARSISAFFVLALVIIGLRLFFQILIGSTVGGHVLFTLPEVPLPAWAAGIRLGGPVTAESLLYSAYDALRLATMLLCIGAANALANPRRALKSIPAALYELSVAVTIALSVAPQLVESVQRVRRARRLRGGKSNGWAAIQAVVIPVLSDAIERSLQLAAGMESRGFGRTRRERPNHLATTALLAGGMLVTFGLYAMLGIARAERLSQGCLLAGGLLVAGGLVLGGRQLGVTRYRPDAWRLPEWLVVACGLGCAALGLVLAEREPFLLTSLELAWPQLHPLMVACAALAIAPAFLTPVPPHRALEVRR